MAEDVVRAKRDIPPELESVRESSLSFCATTDGDARGKLGFQAQLGMDRPPRLVRR
jgi:hypothetical protein